MIEGAGAGVGAGSLRAASGGCCGRCAFEMFNSPYMRGALQGLAGRGWPQQCTPKRLAAVHAHLQTVAWRNRPDPGSDRALVACERPMGACLRSARHAALGCVRAHQSAVWCARARPVQLMKACSASRRQVCAVTRVGVVRRSEARRCRLCAGLMAAAVLQTAIARRVSTFEAITGCILVYACLAGLRSYFGPL